MSLSPQEKKLFFLLVSDIRQKEIAHNLNLSYKTVDSYARNIYKKVGVENRYGLLIWYYTTEKSVIDRLIL